MNSSLQMELHIYYKNLIIPANSQVSKPHKIKDRIPQIFMGKHSLVPSLPSRKTNLETAVKKYGKRDIKVF